MDVDTISAPDLYTLVCSLAVTYLPKPLYQS